MTWHQKAKKDATNSEMLRGDVSNQRSAGIRMGEPNSTNCYYPIMNTQLQRSKPRELKHLSTWRKRKQQRFPKQRRLKGEQPSPSYRVTKSQSSRMVLEKPTTQGESPVYETRRSLVAKSRAEHVEFRLKMRGPSRKAKY